MKLITKIFWFLIIAALVFGGEFVYLRLFKISNTSPVTQTGGESYKISGQKIIDDARPFKINIIYPQIAGQDDFNKIVKNAVDKELADFKENSLANDEMVKKNDPESYAKFPREYYLNISYTKGEINEKAISIILNVENFKGGAHGARYPLALNYSPREKKEIKLTDIFAAKKDYLKVISEYCRKDLEKQLQEKMGSLDGAWINEGAGAKEENFAIFRINSGNTITFYFPEYQVAPYVAGQFEVTMPR